MKKIVCTLLILTIMLAFGTAYAQPGTSPSPVGGDNAQNNESAPKTELISYNSKGEIVARIQLRLRELGYFNFKPTGSFGNMTVEATKHFQQKQTGEDGLPIIADGTVGEQTLGIIFSHRAMRADIAAKIPIGKALSGNPTITGELIGWNEVKEMLSQGSNYLVTDYNTGVTFNIVYLGGENHGEVECATVEDTLVYKDVFGGEYNYSKRPVVVNIGGRNIAASLQGQPHGEKSGIPNDMPGHSCLFFYESNSHVASLPDVEHQTQVFKAAGRD